MSDAEFLDVGEERRPGLPRRVRVALLVGVLLVGLVAFVADRELRQREERAVTSCATEATSAVDLAGRRTRAAYDYVRPSLMQATPELQSAIQRLIAKTAQGADASLTGPRETCAAVTVFPLHDELQERRDRCVAVLEAHQKGLRAVAEDGRALGDWLDVPRSC